jgi:hypothetical protein
MGHQKFNFHFKVFLDGEIAIERIAAIDEYLKTQAPMRRGLWLCGPRFPTYSSAAGSGNVVDKISRVSATAATAATQIQHSTSVAEPDVAWAADRQAAIDEALHRRHGSGGHRPSPAEETEEDGGNASRHLDLHATEQSATGDESDEERLSGESERIGTGNLDEDVPFGDHAGYI